uniref:hypothetical protein n=1 Tax=Microbispora cellulosiformans TaxID=2614688 RepID=UPI001CD945E3|nr:hypothetical protein [Microbispora cellulosiformans]
MRRHDEPDGWEVLLEPFPDLLLPAHVKVHVDLVDEDDAGQMDTQSICRCGVGAIGVVPGDSAALLVGVDLIHLPDRVQDKCGDRTVAVIHLAQ